MTDKLLKLLEEKYTLSPIDAGEFSTLKASGMTFTVSAYHAEGLGHVSLMRAKGFFGLMRMDTLMIVPEEIDLPLYSYDRIHAMGNDTLIVELYDTLTSPLDLSALSASKARFAHLSDRDPGEHWYDEIKLPGSISKKGKRKHTPELDLMATGHFEGYLNADALAVTDRDAKRALSLAYVNGLLERGGPSTDVFKKALGREKTERLFKTLLFGVG
ncbi:MAG: hypothetical protein IKC32_01180 [Clostridia bacterium]|nr:hypothetical protein [Clostridia bacterium]